MGSPGVYWLQRLSGLADLVIRLVGRKAISLQVNLFQRGATGAGYGLVCPASARKSKQTKESSQQTEWVVRGVSRHPRYLRLNFGSRGLC